MKIFLAGIIQGSIKAAQIHSQDWREPIKALLARHCPAVQVYCHYEAHPNSIGYDLPAILETLADGNRRASESDVVICWLPEASMGTAVEMYCAAQAGAVVVTVTPMVANWVVRAYSDAILPDLAALGEFLSAGRLKELLQTKRRRT
jgi:hypothetical protein